jgi:putative transposase
MIAGMNARKPRGPQPEKAHITVRQDEILQMRLRRTKTSQQLAQRARIVRQCATAARNQHIAEDEGVTVQTVKTWRKRWREAEAFLAVIESTGTDQELAAALETTLSDLPRRGAPVKFTAEQVCQIIAVACEPPEAAGRPVTEWTPRELAEEVVQRSIVESISTRQAGRFLKMRVI